MEKTTELLEQILVAQTILVASQIKEERAKRGVKSTSDFISDAVKLIRKKQPEIARLYR